MRSMGMYPSTSVSFAQGSVSYSSFSVVHQNRCSVLTGKTEGKISFCSGIMCSRRMRGVEQVRKWGGQTRIGGFVSICFLPQGACSMGVHFVTCLHSRLCFLSIFWQEAVDWLSWYSKVARDEFASFCDFILPTTQKREMMQKFKLSCTHITLHVLLQLLLIWEAACCIFDGKKIDLWLLENIVKGGSPDFCYWLKKEMYNT